jgi:NAD(P)H-flavin reductase
MAVRSLREQLFTEEIAALEKRDDVEFKPTVDMCPMGELDREHRRDHNLIPKVSFDPEKTYAIICGPPVMYKFVIRDLKTRAL